MILKDIIAISGQPGLFKFIAQGKNSMIVEHIETGRRTSAFSSSKVSSLEEISIFTENEDVPLGKVFDKIYEKENGGPSIDPKSDSQILKSYFEEILPDYSRDKVYVSDIKKVIVWYNILQKKEMLVREEPEKASEAAGTETETGRPESGDETGKAETVKQKAGKKGTKEKAG